MRAVLIDRAAWSSWTDGNHRLHLVGRCLQQKFETIELVNDDAQDHDEVLLAACGRESDIMPLIEASRLVQRIADCKPDICIAPLQGGLAHGVLMARACGELPATLRVLILAEEPSRSLFLRSDPGRTAVKLLLGDAMERFCLEQADALLADRDFPLEQLAALHAEVPPVHFCPDIWLGRDSILIAGTKPSELCFVGAFARSASVTAFIEAAERLLSDGETSLERVVFIGPISALRQAPGKDWLGRRALQWGFPFRVIETSRFADALAHIRRSGNLAYVPDLPPAYRSEIERDGLYANRFVTGKDRNSSILREALVAALARGPIGSKMAEPAMDGRREVCDAVEMAKPRRTRRSVPTTLSICVLHKDRPAYLRQAMASVLAQVDGLGAGQIEVILFDNGSVRHDSLAAIDELSSHPLVELVRQSPALPHSTAMNAMASRAGSDFMAFLDDDNLIADGGLECLLRACSEDVFDVIVSNLYIIEADRPDLEPTAKFAFVGPASTAGLFFNFFGDTCMAFRRDAFERIGGFFDAKAPSPAPDWVLLARAQAAGLKIGVLQNPGFIYRRDVGRADLNWQKYDQHGLRNLVLSHYGDRYDPALLAKLSQGLMVDHYR